MGDGESPESNPASRWDGGRVLERVGILVRGSERKQ